MLKKCLREVDAVTVDKRFTTDSLCRELDGIGLIPKGTYKT